MRLVRLIYCSSVSDELTPSEVIPMLEHAAQNNQKRNITGFIGFNEQHFLQALEGGVGDINKLYKTLIMDTRHRRVVLVSYEDITERAFGDWSMGYMCMAQAKQFLLKSKRGGGMLQYKTKNQLSPLSLTADGALEVLLDLEQKHLSNQANTA